MSTSTVYLFPASHAMEHYPQRHLTHNPQSNWTAKVYSWMDETCAVMVSTEEDYAGLAGDTDVILRGTFCR